MFRIYLFHTFFICFTLFLLLFLVRHWTSCSHDYRMAQREWCGRKTDDQTIKKCVMWKVCTKKRNDVDDDHTEQKRNERGKAHRTKRKVQYDVCKNVFFVVIIFHSFSSDSCFVSSACLLWFAGVFIIFLFALFSVCRFSFSFSPALQSSSIFPPFLSTLYAFSHS